MENYEKLYKEAIERMKSWARGEHPECFSEAQKAAEFVFPELKGTEDERIRKDIIAFIKTNYSSATKWIKWLEKQKPVEQLQISDNRIQYSSIKDGIEAHAQTYSFNIESELFHSLTEEQQKLWREEIERAVISGGECGVELANDERYKENQKSVEWSEGDGKNLNSVKWIIENSENLNRIFETINSSEYIKKYFIDWLESLKPNHWKPSKEQILQLTCALSGCSFETPVLQSLLNDLKKL